MRRGWPCFRGSCATTKWSTRRPSRTRSAWRCVASNGYVWPASHDAGSTSGAPPLGTRLRLKASKDISGYPPQIQKIFQAMKTYGLIIADNGSDMYVTGTMDARWDNGMLNPAFHSLHASDFEVDPTRLGQGHSVGRAERPRSIRGGCVPIYRCAPAAVLPIINPACSRAGRVDSPRRVHPFQGESREHWPHHMSPARSRLPSVANAAEKRPIAKLISSPSTGSPIRRFRPTARGWCSCASW